MKLTFLGAAGTVTGSRYLVETSSSRILVDCGMFQGLKNLRLQNRAPFPVSPDSIQAIVLTHAHIDHSGFIPALMKQGFRGKVFCTEATADLCRILLPDSGHLQEEEARYANKGGFSKHHPALPLYTQEDANQSLELLAPKAFHSRFEVAPGIQARFTHSGHILGSALAYLEIEGHKLLFTGDLGRPSDPILLPPEAPEAVDAVITESTYGNRVHPSTDQEQALGEVIRRTVSRGGVLVIPAFSVGRSQLLLYLIAQLKKRKLIPDVPVYLNSPMSIHATRIMCDHMAEHHLKPEVCEELCEVATYVHTAEESKRLNQLSTPAILISANGMATGGRVIHHLKAFLPHAQNTVLLAGFQAAGTRGASLIQRVETLRIHGQDIPVRAEVSVLHNLSAHADAEELANWLRQMPTQPRHVFITHGEPEASLALQTRIADTLGWASIIPKQGQEIVLEPKPPIQTEMSREQAV